MPKAVFQTLGIRSQWLIDKRIITMAQCIRDRFNKPILINNWSYRPDDEWWYYEYRGWRPTSYYTNQHVYSQHCFGRALDFTLEGIHSEMVRDDIKSHPDIYHDIRGLEEGTTWVHIDCRDTPNGALHCFYPLTEIDHDDTTK